MESLLLLVIIVKVYFFLWYVFIVLVVYGMSGNGCFFKKVLIFLCFLFFKVSVFVLMLKWFFRLMVFCFIGILVIIL